MLVVRRMSAHTQQDIDAAEALQPITSAPQVIVQALSAGRLTAGEAMKL